MANILPHDRQIAVLHHLVEGNTLRSTTRLPASDCHRPSGKRGVDPSHREVGHDAGGEFRPRWVGSHAVLGGLRLPHVRVSNAWRYFTDWISASFAFRDMALIANSRFNALLWFGCSS